jgi:hypothetical protein
LGSGEVKTVEQTAFMKTRMLRLVLAGMTGIFAGGTVTAQTTAPAAAPPAVQAPAETRLPYGVDDVLRLCRAQISEDVVLNFIRNSDIAYNLSSENVVYLRDQGVSDRVIGAMMDERQKVLAQSAAQNPAQAAVQTAPAVTSGSTAPASAPTPAYAPAPAQPPVEVQSAPSTVYVIPNRPNVYDYYTSPYYSPYYYGGYYGGGYGGPVISLGFGFGGGWHGGGHFHGWHHR